MENINDIKICIIGLGFVGGSIFKSFKMKDINVNGYDKYKPSDVKNMTEMFDYDILFLCLPTLFDEKINQYDKKSIYECLNYLKGYTGLIVLKSTIEPETTDKLSIQFPELNFIHNPEFLTARTCFEDFHNQKHIVLGKGLNCSIDNINKLKNLYTTYYPDADISICSSLESESMKIFCNSFYASKIMLFNEYKLLCEKNKSDFNTIKNLMLKNGWINFMHTDVPGHDGKFGYGGDCFPKDTKALNQYMNTKKSPNLIIDSVIKQCENIRTL